MARVMVAVSGGVDSAVACALLKEQGFEVVGITLRLWPHFSGHLPGETGCCAKNAVEDAGLVARRLGIEHEVVDCSDLFEREVIRYFVEEYLAGRTPNPCAICNRKVKFEVLLERVLAGEADYLATGHYARRTYDAATGRYLLRRARDRGKDQSYFLYGLTQEQLARTLFPLGEYTKEEVRQKAMALDLPVASKPESQEICFVIAGDYREFLRARVPEALSPGPILDHFGRVIGRHRGLAEYTIGQRRGLGVALGYPAYVIDLDRERNAVVVGPRELAYRRHLVARDNNFILWATPPSPCRVEAKVRYLAAAAEATLCVVDEGSVRLDFVKPQWAVAPGQAVVYYREDLVAGGGIIERAW